jgi:Sortilin, neurotensin receptor 3,
VNLPFWFSLFAAGLLEVTTALAPADTTTSTNSAPMQAPTVAPVQVKPKVARVHAVRQPLYRDTTEYPPLKLTWNTDTDLRQVLGVFTHPVLPRRAVVATQTGVLLTDDAGQTWTNLTGASSDKVGTINQVVFHPVAPDTFFLGSATSGIWMTTDLGKTFTQVGTKAKGMASDTVTDLIVYPGDPSHQTLLAVHGDAAPGLSWSRDNGQTWSVVSPDFHFRRLAGGEGDAQVLYLTGSTMKEPDVQSLYACSTVGEYAVELVRDVVPTDMNFAPVPFEKSGTLYLATSDSGLHRISAPDTVGEAADPVLVGSKDDSWSSVNVTWGPSPDIMNLYLYDTAKLGLVISSDDLATEQTASDGLMVGSLIKEGAVIRPNANGTVFYASANGSLSIGRQSDDVPVVEVKPALFELEPRGGDSWKDLETGFNDFANAKGSTLAAAKALIQSVGDLTALYHRHDITVTARLPLQPVPPPSVTVDLTRYGGGPEMLLYDDGKHDDGAAGDGVYGGTFSFMPELYRPRGGDKENRSIWPGRVAIGVRATYVDGHHQGAVGVLGIYSKISDLTFWDSNPKANPKDIAVKIQGSVTAEAAPNPAEIHNGGMALRADTKPGSWSVLMMAPYDKSDITSYEAISFWIRTSDGTAPKELYLQLADEPRLSAPTTTGRVPILEGKTLGADYLHVVIPLNKLLVAGTPFQSNSLSQVILSGETTAPATFFIDGLQILARYDAPASTDPAPPAK